ncbi:hypothetical protein CCP3SC1_1030010 [Gammaproteobacteria bacterium]
MIDIFHSTFRDLFSSLLIGGLMLFSGLTAVLITRRNLTQRFFRSSRQVYEERLRAEENLRILQMAVAQSPNPIIITDVEGCIEYVNQAFETTFGYSCGECLGRNPHIIASGKTPFQTYGDLWDSLRGGMPWKGKLFDVAKDGQERIVFSHISPVRDPTGEISHFIGIQEDITERQRLASELDQHRYHLEELIASRTVALQEAELKYRMIADFTYDWGSWIAADGRWIYCSPSSERITGYRAEEFISDPGLFLRIIHAEDREFVQKYHETTTSCHRPHTEISFRIIRRDGQIRWVEYVGQSVFDDSGGYLGRRASHRDISIRKQTEAALVSAQETTALANWRLSETQYAMDQLGIAIHWITAEGRFCYVNQAACALLGYSEDEFLAMALPDIDATIPLDHFKEFLAPLRKHRNHCFETSHRTKDGRLVPVEVTLHIQQATEVEHVIAFVTDITRRKAIELELAEAKLRAEAANQAKSQFLANMSHEIRIPIHAVLGLTQLLLRKAEDLEQRDKLHKISDSILHLQSLINDILDFSKIEAGHMILEVTDFSPTDLITRITGLIASRAQEKGLNLTMDYEELPNRVRGDPTRLAQSLLNYLSNAVRFTERGTIGIAARVVAETVDDFLIRFEVADTGIGIDAEGQSRLFQPFEQVDGSMTRRYGGTGLGLSITRRLIELMGGEVGVESEAKQGSCFWFTVHLGRSTDLVDGVADVVSEKVMISPPDIWETLQRDCAGAWLLLAEDNQLAQEVTVGLLRFFGLRVEHCQ